MWLLLSPRILVAIVLSAGLAFSHFQAYKSGKKAVQQDWDAQTIAQAQATVKLVQDAREKEKVLTTKVNTVAQNYENAKKTNNALVVGLTSSLLDLQNELNKRDAADSSTPTVNHGTSPERVILRDCAVNLQTLAGIAQLHKEQIIALQAYINSVK